MVGTGAPRVLLFTGDGKGKTTAALGMALRAAGHGKRVLVLQFLKSLDDTGEVLALRAMPGVEVRTTGLGFVRGQEEGLVGHRDAAREALRGARQALAHGSADVYVLDEICCALVCGLVSEEEILDAVALAPADSVVVLTGRGATPGLIARADTVTEMRCVKHAYHTGVPAQVGVEM